MMPHSFLGQSRETDSLDPSSDDPLPMGVLKFLKNLYISFSLQIMKEKSKFFVFQLLDGSKKWSLSGYSVFQKYIQGDTVLFGRF